MEEFINCNLIIDSARRKTPYTIILKGTINSGFTARFEISFTGKVEGIDLAYIPTEVQKIFEEDLNRLLGDSPFDASAVKIIKKLKIFTYERSAKTVQRHRNFEKRLNQEIMS
ncbi:hypothetical protein [Heyndrickxia acidicola]|uniref:DUF3870 domain-containing protein n=1 Tax=Heyndrickxia acidicola TaxID=209389 RepID=A0ABU6MFZ5_9BACI|nr:hypothetical protein [Heyndrickxia acidicola]MED1201960.1 hypothetical protein [Heyndrickxia acidicola]